MNASRRTLLYYPSIEIPNGPWLRQALLYFDEVASIFPAQLTWSWEDLGPIGTVPEHMNLLQSEGLYRRFAPESLLRTEHGDDWQPAHDLADQFNSTISSDSYRQRLARPESFKYSRVHAGKLSGNVLYNLDMLGLSKGPMEIEAGEPWLLVETTTAHLYLGIAQK